MINPYTFYIVGFGFSLAIYQLGWSEVYPQLSLKLVAFLLASMSVHFVFSRLWAKRREIKNDKGGLVVEPKLNPWLITVFLYLLWTIDFIYEGGIPLVKMLLNIPYDYKVFGFPSLHVFTVTFSSFYCIYLLHFFLINRKKIFLLLYFVNISAAILIGGRGMLFINLVSSFFLYLLHLKKIPLKKLLIGVPVMIILLYFFGVLGTMRVSFESNREYDKNIFLESGGATAQFKQSTIPKEFYWPYIYISSPVANLQVNINTYPVKPITIQRVLLYINNEWLFESISKRINKALRVEREKENTTKEQFNASTVYSRSYSYWGWGGIITTGIFILLLPYFYNKMLNDNPYQIISVAILCTTYLLLAFDNTIRFMGLGFQLVYPFVFPFFENKLREIRFRK
jgi:oligosaccharide repeat unit polymerase